MESSTRARLDLAVHDQPEIVPLDGVSSLELPVRPQPEGPAIRDGHAALRAGAVIAIARRVRLRGPVGLLGQLPCGEAGDPDLERLRSPERSPDAPVDDEIVPGRDAGALLLEVLLEARDRGKAPARGPRPG